MTSSIYDHFIIFPSSVTLTFDLPTYDFFHKEYKSKKKFFFFFFGGGGGGEGAAEGVGAAGRGVDRWTEEQSQTNLPLQLLRSWGHNNALMTKLCKLCP